MFAKLFLTMGSWKTILLSAGLLAIWEGNLCIEFVAGPTGGSDPHFRGAESVWLKALIWHIKLFQPIVGRTAWRFAPFPLALA